MSSVTIDGTTTELYDSQEVIDLFAPVRPVNQIDGFKIVHRLKTYRLFSKTDGGQGKVMHAPDGFTWEPGLKAASATTMSTRRLYFDKAQVDALVASLA